MMKKRVLSLALVFCMTMGLVSPVFADTAETEIPDSLVPEESTSEDVTTELSLFETQQFQENMTFLIKINAVRVKNGIGPLAVTEEMLTAAQTRAQEIETVCSNTRPNELYWSSILTETGLIIDEATMKAKEYDGYELKGAGPSNAADIYEEWMDNSSTTLKRNSVSIMGLGHTDGKTVINNKECSNPWTLLLLGKHTALNMEFVNLSEEAYPAGLSLTDMGLILKIRLRSPEGVEYDGYLPLLASMCTGFDSTKTGTQTVTVTYEDTFATPTEKLSFTFDITTKKASKPSTPTTFKATGTSYNKVTVTWSPVEGASAYEIYRSTKKSSDYKKIATIKPRNITLSEDGLYTYIDKDRTSGVKYYYKMRATNGSAAGSYTSVDEAKPNIKAPTGLKVKSKGKKSITIKWSKVDKATSYRVYYSKKKNGTYKRATKPSTKKTTYTISKLKRKTTYYIKILAYRGDYPSSYSSILKVKTK